MTHTLDTQPEVLLLRKIKETANSALDQIKGVEGYLKNQSGIFRHLGFPDMGIDLEEINKLKKKLSEHVLEKAVNVLIGKTGDRDNLVHHLILNASRGPTSNVWPKEHQAQYLAENFDPEVIWNTFATRYGSTSLFIHYSKMKMAWEDLLTMEEGRRVLHIRHPGKKTILSINCRILLEAQNYATNEKVYQITHEWTGRLQRFEATLEIIQWACGIETDAPPNLLGMNEFLATRSSATRLTGREMFAWQEMTGAEASLACFNAWRFSTDGHIEFEINDKSNVEFQLVEILRREITSDDPAARVMFNENMRSQLPVHREI